MRHDTVRYLTTAALMTTLTAICAQLMLPLPFTPVFFNMAVFAVLLAGALLPPRWAVLSQAAYLLLGVAGLPVFGGFRAGAGVLVGPTGGYALSYPLMALAVALLVRSGWRSLPRQLAACALGLAPCHLMGVLWLAMSTGRTPAEAFLAGSAPFLVPDLLKAALAAWMGLRLHRLLEQGNR